MLINFETRRVKFSMEFKNNCLSNETFYVNITNMETERNFEVISCNFNAVGVVFVET